MARLYREWPGYQDSFIYFNIPGRRSSPCLKAGGSAAKKFAEGEDQCALLCQRIGIRYCLNSQDPGPQSHTAEEPAEDLRGQRLR